MAEVGPEEFRPAEVRLANGRPAKVRSSEVGLDKWILLSVDSTPLRLAGGKNPYRPESKPYILFGFLLERKFGPVRLFLNAENLADVRQTRWNSLLLPNRALDGRWTVDAWSPLDGRIFNGGVRFGLLIRQICSAPIWVTNDPSGKKLHAGACISLLILLL